MSESFLVKRLKQEVEEHIFDQGYGRIEICLDMLNHKQIWYRPNDSTNSVGHLILHLCGNARQWILSTFGGHEDIRERDLEFDTTAQLSKNDLLRALESLKKEALPVLAGITEDDLTQKYKVQVFEKDGFHLLMHVTEHFGYHVGQITWITKWLVDEETGYYAEYGL